MLRHVHVDPACRDADLKLPSAMAPLARVSMLALALRCRASTTMDDDSVEHGGKE